MVRYTEAHYPPTFRKNDVIELCRHIANHTSVTVIGMKRVGIGNFLRFFLHQTAHHRQYLGSDKHLFLVVDFNHLAERSLFAFWMLTLKRLVDTIEAGDFPAAMKEQSRATFTQSIQLRDFFFTLESIHKLVRLLVDQQFFVTFFLLRFDRLHDVFTAEFFANLLGVKNNSKYVNYVFTSYRPLPQLAPTVFSKMNLSGVCEEMYIQPSTPEDAEVATHQFMEQYQDTIDPKNKKILIDLAGGHMQYLHLLLMKAHNQQLPKAVYTQPEQLKHVLLRDEEIRLLSEEIMSGLTQTEQHALLSPVLPSVRASDTAYLWQTGMLASPKLPKIFSPLFQDWLHHQRQARTGTKQELTKKEHALFQLLLSHHNELVEREIIVDTVWPDEVELGVSDWSVDRLVSRVRTKLRSQKSPYKIVTVITRGYKLV